MSKTTGFSPKVSFFKSTSHKLILEAWPNRQSSFKRMRWYVKVHNSTPFAFKNSKSHNEYPHPTHQKKKREFLLQFFISKSVLCYDSWNWKRTGRWSRVRCHGSFFDNREFPWGRWGMARNSRCRSGLYPSPLKHQIFYCGKVQTLDLCLTHTSCATLLPH